MRKRKSRGRGRELGRDLIELGSTNGPRLRSTGKFILKEEEKKKKKKNESDNNDSVAEFRHERKPECSVGSEPGEW